MEKKNTEISQQDFVDNGSSSIRVYELPSGYVDPEGKVHTEIVIREMTGVEEDLLVSGSSGVLETVVKRCVTRVGKYEQNCKEWNTIFDSLPYSDLVFCLIRIRVVSLGREMNLRVTCPKCANISSQNLDLFDFEIEGNKDKERKVSGELPSGKKFVIHVHTLKDEEHTHKIKEAMTKEIMMRLEALDGDRPTVAMVRHLTMRDRSYLRSAIRQLEGKIDNEVEVTCPHCMHEFKAAMSVGDSSFFFPSEI